MVFLYYVRLHKGYKLRVIYYNLIRILKYSLINSLHYLLHYIKFINF